MTLLSVGAFVPSHSHGSLLVLFAMFQCFGRDALFIPLQVLKPFSSHYVLFHFVSLCPHAAFQKAVKTQGELVGGRR